MLISLFCLEEGLTLWKHDMAIKHNKNLNNFDFIKNACIRDPLNCELCWLHLCSELMKFLSSHISETGFLGIRAHL